MMLGGVRAATDTLVAPPVDTHAAPFRHMRRVVVSGGDDNLTGLDVAGRGAQQPTAEPPVDAFDRRLESDV
jgi:hypothetical protein